MPGDAPRLPLPAHARADDEVVAAGTDRFDQGCDAGRIVGAVAVHEHDDVGLGGGVDAGHAGAPIALFDPDHICARAGGARGGAVTARAVGDNDALDEVARDGAHHGAD